MNKRVVALKPILKAIRKWNAVYNNDNYISIAIVDGSDFIMANNSRDESKYPFSVNFTDADLKGD